MEDNGTFSASGFSVRALAGLDTVLKAHAKALVRAQENLLLYGSGVERSSWLQEPIIPAGAHPEYRIGAGGVVRGPVREPGPTPATVGIFHGKTLPERRAERKRQKKARKSNRRK